MGAFLHTWLLGYRSPTRFAEALRGKPAPHWGFYGQVARALLDALVLYLPLALLGRQPSTPSYITLLPTPQYHRSLVFLAPVVLLAQWLFLAAALHLVLRLAGRPSGMDQVLNITGMVGLVIGAFLLVWDWACVLLGFRSDVLLGVSHLVVDLWAIALTVAGLRRLLGVPVRLAVLLNILWLALGVPIAMLFMRAPV